MFLVENLMSVKQNVRIYNNNMPMILRTILEDIRCSISI